jgi:hypothetical protein
MPGLPEVYVTAFGIIVLPDKRILSIRDSETRRPCPMWECSAAQHLQSSGIDPDATLRKGFLERYTLDIGNVGGHISNTKTFSQDRNINRRYAVLIYTATEGFRVKAHAEKVVRALSFHYILDQLSDVHNKYAFTFDTEFVFKSLNSVGWRPGK